MAELFRSLFVDLVEGNNDGLVGEERLDVVEEVALLLQRVAALFCDVQNTYHTCTQMRQRCDSLRGQSSSKNGHITYTKLYSHYV